MNAQPTNVRCDRHARHDGPASGHQPEPVAAPAVAEPVAAPAEPTVVNQWTDENGNT